jgi:hypothetical protein
MDSSREHAALSWFTINELHEQDWIHHILVLMVPVQESHPSAVSKDYAAANPFSESCITFSFCDCPAFRHLVERDRTTSEMYQFK